MLYITVPAFLAKVMRESGDARSVKASCYPAGSLATLTAEAASTKKSRHSLLSFCHTVCKRSTICALTQLYSQLQRRTFCQVAQPLCTFTHSVLLLQRPCFDVRSRTFRRRSSRNSSWSSLRWSVTCAQHALRSGPLSRVSRLPCSSSLAMFYGPAQQRPSMRFVIATMLQVTRRSEQARLGPAAEQRACGVGSHNGERQQGESWAEGDGRASMPRTCGSLAASSITTTAGSSSQTGISCWARLGAAAEQRPMVTRTMLSGIRVSYGRELLGAPWCRGRAAGRRCRARW